MTSSIPIISGLFRSLAWGLAVALLLCSPVRGADADDADARRGVELPLLTGSHAVGTQVLHLRDHTRTNREGERGPRDLMVQLWYPARRAAGPPAPYLPDPRLLAAMKGQGNPDLTPYLDLATDIHDGWGRMTTRSRLDLAPTPAPDRLPLLIFSPGFGLSRSSYSALLQELASHGLAVAAIDHPHEGLTVLSDGRVLSHEIHSDAERTMQATIRRIEEMAADARFVVDALLTGEPPTRLSGRIDRSRIGFLGHSLGGAAALEGCRGEDSPFRACADMDGDSWKDTGIQRPYLVLLNVPAQAVRPPAAMARQRDDEWAAILSGSGAPAYVIKLENTNHFSFTDAAFVVPRAMMEKNGATIDPARGFEIVSALLRGFFARFLGDDAAHSPETVVNGFPEASLALHICPGS